ncbi:hypothetical protein [Raoultella ornithinolytica]|uniref:hypothetical protein n=1 Tax=Raoultella ornithinolytica TaxID=54291 RepID=UPI000E5776EF|nr:hypothetical protein [Raoultella ornithinolytica]
MKIKKICVGILLALASGCDDASVKPPGLVLNKDLSQVDMAGYTMVDQDGKATDKPVKAKDRFSQYLYAPSEYVGKVLKEEKDTDLIIFNTLDGKIAYSIVNVSVNEMKTVQDVLKSKYGPALATRAGVRDKAAFESSPGFCKAYNPEAGLEQNHCPMDYYEIYGTVDEAYMLVKAKSIYANGPEKLLVAGITRDAKNYLDSIK